MSPQIRNTKCKHGLVLCSRCVVVTDAARRMSDLVNLMITCKSWDELQNGYMAFRLDNGSSDGVLYDSKQTAAKFTDDKRHAYFCFRQAMGGANARDCQIFLDLNRYAADNGVPMAEPYAKKQSNLILSTAGYDFMVGRRQP